MNIEIHIWPYGHKMFEYDFHTHTPESSSCNTEFIARSDWLVFFDYENKTFAWKFHDHKLCCPSWLYRCSWFPTDILILKFASLFHLWVKCQPSQINGWAVLFKGTQSPDLEFFNLPNTEVVIYQLYKRETIASTTIKILLVDSSHKTYNPRT